MSLEEYGLKKYFLQLNLPDARLKFRERMGCMKTCLVDYPNDPKSRASSYLCGCGKLDVRQHWKRCFLYSHLSNKVKDWENDVEVLTFYREIIRMRNEM